MGQHISVYVVALPAVYVLFRKLSNALRSFFVRKLTVLYDLPDLGCTRPNNKSLKGAAVICGGSIAGLWTARICADHFEEVILVEPEAWLSTEEGIADVYNDKGIKIDGRGVNPRTRVQQYRAQHVFQPLALVALRKLFPNFDDEIRRMDGRITDADYKLHMFGKTRHVPREVYPDESYSQVFFITRESFERVLRRLVLGSSKRIRWIAGLATGVVLDKNDPMVLQAVTVRTESGNEETIPASLVIDCTGSSQAGVKWLRRIFTESEQAAVLHSATPRASLAFDGNLKIEYNTRQRYRKFRFYLPPEMRSRLPIPGGYDKATWLFTYMPRPGIERELFMIERMEGHRIEMAFGGWGDVPLPETFADVKDWLRNLRPDAAIPEWIFDLVDILSDICEDCETELGRYPNCSWIRYERAPYIPSNFVAIGDSVMRVNPTFGQGCSKAAIGAITLDSLLRRPSLLNSTTIPADFGRLFFKYHSARIAETWNGTKPTDYQWDTTIPVKGEQLSDEHFKGKIVSLLMQLSGTDEAANSAIWHARTFLAPSTDLLHPSILAKCFVLYLRQQFGWA